MQHGQSWLSLPALFQAGSERAGLVRSALWGLLSLGLLEWILAGTQDGPATGRMVLWALFLLAGLIAQSVPAVPAPAVFDGVYRAHMAGLWAVGLVFGWRTVEFVISGSWAAAGREGLLAFGALICAASLFHLRRWSGTTVRQMIGELRKSQARMEAQRAALQEKARLVEMKHGRLKAVLSMLPMGVAVSDAQGRLVEANRAAEAIRGWPIGDQAWPFSKALQFGEPTEGTEISVQTGDGSVRTLLVSAVPVRDESGEVVNAVAVSIDITQRKQMEETLKESQGSLADQKEILHQIVTDTPLSRVLETVAVCTERHIRDCHCAVFLLDETGGTFRLAAGPTVPGELSAVMGRFPLRADAGVTGPAVMQRQAVVCSDVTKDPWLAEYADLTIRNGVHALWSLPVMSRDGEVLGAVTVLCKAARSPSHGEVAWVETAADLASIAITRRRMEEGGVRKLQHLLQNVAEAVIAVENKGRILLLNPAAERYLGLKPGSEGQSLYELGLPEPLVRLLADAASPGTYRTEHCTFRTGKLELEATVSPIFSDLGRHGAVAVLQDITERVQLRTLQQNFVANVSHELRGPLASISATLEAMSDGVIPEQQRTRYLRAVLDEMARLRRLSYDVIDLTQLDSGLLQLRSEAVSLGEVFRQIREKFEQRCADLGVGLEVGASDLTVQGDRDRVNQVITNLVDNAIKHASPDGRIRVWGRREGEGVRIGVSDNGPGISVEHLPYLWERFYKVSRARTPVPGGGTGLGLSIVRELVERMGGQVLAESVPGDGSCFSFTLPALP